MCDGRHGILHDDLTFFTNEPGATLLDRFRKTLKEQLPIPAVSYAQKSTIIKCVEKILADLESSDISHLETAINELVYDLYDLAP